MFQFFLFLSQKGTALIYAAYFGRRKIVQLLLERGADRSWQDVCVCMCVC